MTYAAKDPLVMRQVFRLVERDVARATSPRDLAERLARNGYELRPTPAGTVLVTVPHGVELGPFPALR